MHCGLQQHGIARRTPAAARGFALLMTLVLVTLAGVAMTAVARRSVSEALAAEADLQRLRCRWGARSLRALLAPQLEDLLAQAERGPEDEDEQDAGFGEPPPFTPVPRLELRCRLAGIDYTAVVTDEQAKANVNALLKARGPKCAATLRDLVRAGGAASGSRGLREKVSTLALRPLAADRALVVARVLPRVAGYGQVFPAAGAEDLLGSASGGARRGPLVSELTCWGDGRLNLRRASDAALRARCEDALGEAVTARLLKQRRRDPSVNLAQLPGRIQGLDPDQREALQARLCEQSSCHGLWIVAAAGPLRRYSFTVIGGDARNTRNTRNTENDNTAATDAPRTLSVLHACAWPDDWMP